MESFSGNSPGKECTGITIPLSHLGFPTPISVPSHSRCTNAGMWTLLCCSLLSSKWSHSSYIPSGICLLIINRNQNRHKRGKLGHRQGFQTQILCPLWAHLRPCCIPDLPGCWPLTPGMFVSTFPFCFHFQHLFIPRGQSLALEWERIWDSQANFFRDNSPLLPPLMLAFRKFSPVVQTFSSSSLSSCIQHAFFDSQSQLKERTLMFQHSASWHLSFLPLQYRVSPYLATLSPESCPPASAEQLQMSDCLLMGPIFQAATRWSLLFSGPGVPSKGCKLLSNSLLPSPLLQSIHPLLKPSQREHAFFCQERINNAVVPCDLLFEAGSHRAFTGQSGHVTSLPSWSFLQTYSLTPTLQDLKPHLCSLPCSALAPSECYPFQKSLSFTCTQFYLPQEVVSSPIHLPSPIRSTEIHIMPIEQLWCFQFLLSSLESRLDTLIWPIKISLVKIALEESFPSLLYKNPLHCTPLIQADQSQPHTLLHSVQEKQDLDITHWWQTFLMSPVTFLLFLLWISHSSPWLPTSITSHLLGWSPDLFPGMVLGIPSLTVCSPSHGASSPAQHPCIAWIEQLPAAPIYCIMLWKHCHTHLIYFSCDTKEKSLCGSCKRLRWNVS